MASDRDMNKMVVALKLQEIRQLQEEVTSYKDMGEREWAFEAQNKINSLQKEIIALRG